MHYAAYFHLHDKPVLVVGGGQVAARKVQNLLNAGARVTVVSPQLHDALQDAVRQQQAQYVARTYQSDDVSGAVLVFAATDDTAVNQMVARDAKARGIPVNVADNPAACDFIVPAVVHYKGVHFAISTSGQSPALAKALRVAMESDLQDGGRRFYELIRNLESGP